MTHSILSAEALLLDTTTKYAIGSPENCRLLKRGLNDTYLVVTSKGQFVLRVYRSGWRSASEIQYEIDLLLHLKRGGVSVSYPLECLEKGHISSINAPEGERFSVLFTYAPGHRIMTSLEENHSYGSAVAEIHNAASDFVTDQKHFSIDMQFLIDRSINPIEPLLLHRPDDWRFLAQISHVIQTRIKELQRGGLTYGICHGDTHGGNAHIDEHHRITSFDFDCCGPGWTSYDIAVFRWSSEKSESHDLQWDLFLEGYSKKRLLNSADFAAIPAFVAARQIWLMGLHAANGKDWGFGWIDEKYFNKSFDFLRRWSDEHL